MYLPTRLPTDETETRADPFSLDALIAWLRTKNPEETYCYTSNGQCLIAQYLESIGIENPQVIPNYWFLDIGGEWHPLPHRWNEIAIGDGTTRPKTFGAALSRATAIKQS